MTPSELKHHVEAAGHEPYFFQRKTMAFFGDTVRNYGVRARLIMSDYDRAGTYVEGGSPILVWELYRKRPVKDIRYAFRLDFRSQETLGTPVC